jgi:transposase
MPDTTMIIIDAKSIKNTYLAELKGYDGGKKISGIKLHIGVDILGLPHAIFISTANVTDRSGAIEMLKLNAADLPRVLKALCDGGYTGENFENEVKKIIGAEVEIAKRSELHKFAVIPKRWVVERNNYFIRRSIFYNLTFPYSASQTCETAMNTAS